jgi:hypothetical protein
MLISCLKGTGASVSTPVPLPCVAVANAQQIRERTTQEGRKFVRSRGKREAAHKVWEQYGKPGKLAVGRVRSGFFFCFQADWTERARGRVSFDAACRLPPACVPSTETDP